MNANSLNAANSRGVGFTSQRTRDRMVTRLREQGIVDEAVQLVGGEALVVGHPLEAVLRRLRALRLAEGETDTLRVNLARGFLDLGKGRL